MKTGNERSEYPAYSEELENIFGADAVERLSSLCAGIGRAEHDVLRDALSEKCLRLKDFVDAGVKWDERLKRYRLEREMPGGPEDRIARGHIVTDDGAEAIPTVVRGPADSPLEFPDGFRIVPAIGLVHEGGCGESPYASDLDGEFLHNKLVAYFLHLCAKTKIRPIYALGQAISLKNKEMAHELYRDSYNKEREIDRG